MGRCYIQSYQRLTLESLQLVHLQRAVEMLCFFKVEKRFSEISCLLAQEEKT